MKRKIAIVAVRAIGTLAGLQGAVMVYMTAHMAVASGDDNSWFGSIFFVVLSLIIAMVLIWIAYLVWFRFSPRAVQQVCGLLGFVLLTTAGTYFRPADEANALWWSLGFLVLLLFVLWGYRTLSRYVSNVIFVGQRFSTDQLPLP
jgi:hypothetical protein